MKQICACASGFSSDFVAERFVWVTEISVTRKKFYVLFLLETKIFDFFKNKMLHIFLYYAILYFFLLYLYYIFVLCYFVIVSCNTFTLHYMRNRHSQKSNQIFERRINLWNWYCQVVNNLHYNLKQVHARIKMRI